MEKESDFPPSVSKTANMVRMIPYTNRETNPEKQTAVPWVIFKREAALKTASKHVSIWTPPCVYKTGCLKGSPRSCRKAGKLTNYT